MSGNTQESRLDGIFSKGVTRSEFDSFKKEISRACFARIEEVREELHTRMNTQGNGFNERIKKHKVSLAEVTDSINQLSRRLVSVEHYLANPDLTEPSSSSEQDGQEENAYNDQGGNDDNDQEENDDNDQEEENDDEEISDIEPADEQEDGDEQEEIVSPSSSSGSESSSTSDSGDSESDQSDEETQDYYSRRYRNAEENGPEY